MRMTVPVEVNVDTQTINITLPMGTPLMCDGKEAARLFGVSERSLASLRRNYRDFPVRKVGASVKYLVPDLYAWFRDFAGPIETE